MKGQRPAMSNEGRATSKGFSLFKLIANCSILIALTACSYAQIKTQPSVDVFPVETAHEDGDWTLLYRDVPLEISEDGFVIFMLPRDWMPLGLSDYDHLKVSSVISEDKAVLTFERFRP